MEPETANQLLHLGPYGVLLAVFLFCIKYIMEQQRQDRAELIKVIQENTKAFIELREAIINSRQ